MKRKLTLVPSGSRMVRQTDFSSRTVMHSSTSLSMTVTVLQLISSRAGKGWYVTFMSSFSTPGMSNLAVTCRAQKRGEASKCGFEEHVDRCDPHPGAIGGLLELHTTRGGSWSYHMFRAYTYTYVGTWDVEKLTSIAASSEEVLESPHARLTAETAPGARL